MQTRILLVGIFTSFLCTTTVIASDGPYLNLEEIANQAERIVVVEAIESRADPVATRGGDTVVTTVTFRVREALKGAASVLLPLEFHGGVVGNIREEFPNMPTFEIGDRAVLFLSGVPAPSPVVGHREGWFPITVSPNGTEHVTRFDDRAFSATDQISTPITVSRQPIPTMTLAAFLAKVNQVLARGVATGHTPITAANLSTPAESNTSYASVLPPYDLEPATIPFPPRDQALVFFEELETTYNKDLERSADNPGYVDPEGSAVWFPEWLRYVLNRCSAADATNRVFMQIRGEGIQPVCGSAEEGVINFPPRDQSLDFLEALDALYRDELNRSELLSYIDLEGKAVWLQEYLRYRVNGCDHKSAGARVFGQIGGGGVLALCDATSRTSFGAGTYLIGTDLSSGRYYTDPGAWCYWKRTNGRTDVFNIIANDLWAGDVNQAIVDISPSDLYFETDADCGTWFDTPRHEGTSTEIAPGQWLIGSQVTSGTYMSIQLSTGCYWERLSGFGGSVLDDVLANDYIGEDELGLKMVTILASDVGFKTDDDCGTWTKVSPVESLPRSQPKDPSAVERERQLQREQHLDIWLAHEQR